VEQISKKPITLVTLVTLVTKFLRIRIFHGSAITAITTITFLRFLKEIFINKSNRVLLVMAVIVDLYIFLGIVYVMRVVNNS